jgi:hypothetical protein
MFVIYITQKVTLFRGGQPPELEQQKHYKNPKKITKNPKTQKKLKITKNQKKINQKPP